MKGFQIVGPRTVRDDEGRTHDVFEAIERLPWVDQTCPSMPHQYAHLRKSDRVDYGVVDTMLTAKNPETYRAYFRGYQSANRYLGCPGRPALLVNDVHDQSLLARQRRAPPPS